MRVKMPLSFSSPGSEMTRARKGLRASLSICVIILHPQLRWLRNLVPRVAPGGGKDERPWERGCWLRCCGNGVLACEGRGGYGCRLGCIGMTNLATWPPKHQRWRPSSLVQSIPFKRTFFLSLGGLSWFQNKNKDSFECLDNLSDDSCAIKRIQHSKRKARYLPS